MNLRYGPNVVSIKCVFLKVSSQFFVVFIIFSTADNCFGLLVLISTLREILRDLALFHVTRYILVHGYTHFLWSGIVQIWCRDSLQGSKGVLFEKFLNFNIFCQTSLDLELFWPHITLCEFWYMIQHTSTFLMTLILGIYLLYKVLQWCCF